MTAKLFFAFGRRAGSGFGKRSFRDVGSQTEFGNQTKNLKQPHPAFDLIEPIQTAAQVQFEIRQRMEVRHRLARQDLAALVRLDETTYSRETGLIAQLLRERPIFGPEV